MRDIEVPPTGPPHISTESDTPMQVSVAHHPPNTAVLVLRGSLDIDTAPVLKANLARLVDRPAPRVVVDVSGLDFCDSMGVGVLVTAHGRAQEKDGWVRLAAPSGFLRRLFDTLGLTDYLALFPDVETALKD
ncbi:STAS domain-containing protein [Paractinoplanes aksuensis]|uniref:STAS domain-containing protein n=1 Tax=Paractinoplanes aksuensis TaxID=2939490 RepID=UPI003F692995